MKKLKHSRAIHISLLVAVAIVTTALLTHFDRTAEIQAQIETRTMHQRDQSSLEKIRTLLAPKGVTVAEEHLLPSRSADANTLLVRFTAMDQIGLGGALLKELPAESSATIVESRLETGRATRPRALELSQTLVFVVAINGQGDLKWWTMQPDPRIVRAETSNERGELSGTTLYKASAETLVSYPRDSSITTIRFYSPRWHDNAYELDLIGEIAVDGGAK
jgi:hypothetical protein